MFHHLRTKLTVLYAGLFALALAVVSVATYGAIAENARHVIHDELNAGGAVFDRIWTLRSEQLEQAATVLAADFGFRTAVATQDHATTQSALENLRARLNLDQAIFIGLDGAPIVAGGGALGAGSAELASALESADGPTSGVLNIGGATYQAIAVPVMAPISIGWVVFAKKLDRNEMSALERLSAIPLDALVATRAANGAWTTPTARMSAADQAVLGDFINRNLYAKNPGVLRLRTSAGQSIALIRPLKSMRDNRPAVLLLRYPMDRAMAPYRPLLAVIVLAGLAGLILLAMGSWALARGLTRPISALEDAVNRLRDGETARVAISTSDEIGRLSNSFNTMAADIRAREDELNSTRAFLNAVVENLPAMVVVKDRDQRFALINRAGEALLGMGRSEVIGKTDHDLFPKDQADAFVERDRAVLESGRLQVILDEPISTLANGLRYLQTKKIAIADRDGAPRYVVAISEDITERKEAAEALELALHQAEAASRAKGSFLANMSHEVRTPLNGVLGVTSVLSDTALDPGQREMVDIIATSATQLQRVLCDVLDLARVEAGQLHIVEEDFHLGETLRAVAAVARGQAAARGIKFRLEIEAAADGVARGDRKRLEQILSNLLGNAHKFTEAGEIALTAGRVDGVCRIEVRDTGIGFDPAITQSLFEPFMQADGSNTRRFGGMGLGLGISRNLARAMGGDLTAEGTPGVGAVFAFTAPFPPAETSQVETPPVLETAAPSDEPMASAGPPIRVLVVDDHATNRKVVELILASVGLEMVSAENGAEAVDVFKAQAFDVVLMDIQMPVMDGLTAIRQIRQFEASRGGRPTPILVLSANTMPEHVQGAAEAGADGHLSKPITAPELLTALEAALDAADGAGRDDQAAVA